MDPCRPFKQRGHGYTAQSWVSNELNQMVWPHVRFMHGCCTLSVSNSKDMGNMTALLDGQA